MIAYPVLDIALFSRHIVTLTYMHVFMTWCIRVPVQVSPWHPTPVFIVTARCGHMYISNCIVPWAAASGVGGDRDLIP